VILIVSLTQGINDAVGTVGIQDRHFAGQAGNNVACGSLPFPLHITLEVKYAGARIS
jgi:hypothetical protein